MHINDKPPGRIIIILTVAATILASCGSSGGTAVTPLSTSTTPSTTSATAATPATTTTLVASDGAAIAADHAEIALYFEVASQNPIDPADPRIAMLAVGAALSYHRNQLTILSVKREHDVGTFVPTASTVTQRNGTAVVVSSCALDSIAVVDDASGQVVTPATNSRDPINERLDLVNGRWIVSESGLASGTC